MRASLAVVPSGLIVLALTPVRDSLAFFSKDFPLRSEVRHDHEQIDQLSAHDDFALILNSMAVSR
jgi:hypothetical protein